MEQASRTHPSVLVVVDMQQCFRRSDSQWCVPRYDEIVPVIGALEHSFEGRSMYTRFVADPAEPGAWKSYYDRWDEMRLPPDAADWDFTVEVPADAQTLSVPTFSKWGPTLAELVPPGGELVLAGVATDCCVLSTALGAIDAGRFVTVISDACAAVSDEAQAQTLAILRLLAPLCRVVTSAEFASVQARRSNSPDRTSL